jgi:5-methyltetrahydropteroyltriglutamate--homocysteine methyltransferase
MGAEKTLPARPEALARPAAAHVDHVGSLLRPPALMAAWREHEAGRRSAEALAAVLDEAIAAVVRMQEALGLAVVTDGEFRRGGWSRGFLTAIEGFDFKPSKLVFRNEAGVSTAAPAPVVTRKLRRKHWVVADDFAYLRRVARRRAKVTMPTPSHIHFGHFGDGIDREAYPDRDAFFDDLVGLYREEIAELGRRGCDFLQLDEVPLTLCCDEVNRGVARAAGEDPDRLIDFYIDLVNRIVAGRPKGMTVAVHLCRGNMQGLWMGDGGYGPIAEKLFNTLDVDAFLLEYDSPRAGDFAPLRHVPAGKRAFLGLVSTKSPLAETPHALERRLREAERHAPLERLGLCPQCGFASSAMSKFNVLPNPMTEALQAKKLAVMLDVAGQVWK